MSDSSLGGGPNARRRSQFIRRQLKLPYSDLSLTDKSDLPMALDDHFGLGVVLPYGIGPNEPRLLQTDDAGNLKVVNAAAPLALGAQVPGVQAYPILFQDDAEGLLQWASGNSTVALLATQAHRGTHSVQMTTAAPTATYTMQANGPGHHDGRFRFSAWVFFGAITNWSWMAFQVSRIDASTGTYVDIIIRYNFQTGQWQYKSADGPATYTNLPGVVPAQLAITVWHYIEFEADFRTRQIFTVRIGGKRYDFTGTNQILGTTGATGSLDTTQMVVIATNQNAVAVSLDVDDVLLVGLDP